MESLDTAAGFVDDLLDFALEEEDDDEEHNHHTKKPRKALASLNPNGPFNILGQEDGLNCSLPEFVEEELEWISNKDAFPTLETCFDFPLEHSGSTTLKHHSPVSVLDSNTTSNKKKTGKFTNHSIITSYCGSLRVPGKARSKRQLKCRRDLQDQRFWWSKENFTVVRPAENAEPVEKVAKIGRKCHHCGSEKTPQWRAGPLGPKTLCNACGVRFKSGRLVPEYRPASSPTFSSVLHSNSHRKVVEMRKQKEMMGLPVVKPEEKG